MAAVGNVMTHVDFRGRGYAKATTSAVTQELLRTCDDVVLNVRSDNPPALAAYRALALGELGSQLLDRRVESDLVPDVVQAIDDDFAVDTGLFDVPHVGPNLAWAAPHGATFVL